MSKKVAVLFPGIGYTCEKPLLYYAGKLAAAKEYEIVKVEYGNFPSGIKGNKEKMEAAFYSGLEQAEEILKEVRWEEYKEILFLSKSVGTIISSAYSQKYHLNVRNVLFTPLQQTFLFANGRSLVFHGTADPWAKTDDILEECEKRNLPIILIEKGNHSLETGDVKKDIENLGQVMRKVDEFI